MVVVVVLTINLQNQTIWRLLEIKLEVLAQIAPAVMLGTQIKKIGAYPVFIGAFFGTLSAVYITMSSSPKPFGVHAGIWGLIVNVILITIIYKGTYAGRTGRPSDAK